jgi:hypothetical protein
MTDTTPEILHIQQEIFLSKSASERFRIGNDLNRFGRVVLESSIRQEHPGISGIDLKIAVFKRCYGDLYSQEEFDRIILAMKNYLGSY